MARKDDDNPAPDDQATADSPSSEDGSEEDASEAQTTATTSPAGEDTPATNDPGTAALPGTAEPKKRGKQWRLQLGAGNRPYPSISVAVDGRSLVVESRRPTPPVSTQAKNTVKKTLSDFGLEEDDLHVEEVK